MVSAGRPYVNPQEIRETVDWLMGISIDKQDFSRWWTDLEMCYAAIYYKVGLAISKNKTWMVFNPKLPMVTIINYSNKHWAHYKSPTI